MLTIHAARIPQGCDQLCWCNFITFKKIAALMECKNLEETAIKIQLVFNGAHTTTALLYSKHSVLSVMKLEVATYLKCAPLVITNNSVLIGIAVLTVHAVLIPQGRNQLCSCNSITLKLLWRVNCSMRKY